MSNRRRLSKPPATTFVHRLHTSLPTFWNGQPTPAVPVRVIVADAPGVQQYWARDLVGTEREAVRVTYCGAVFYLDNEDGSGWRKVTDGRGSPRWGHRSLWVQREGFVARSQSREASDG